MKNLLIMMFLTAGIVCGNAQNFPKKKKKEDPKKEAAAPVQAPPKAAPSPNDVKPYKDVITKEAVTLDGMFKVHHVKDKYYFEIPDSLLGREILAVNRISKAPVSRNKQQTGYAVDQIGEDVIRFDKVGDKLYLRSVSYLEEATDTTNMYLSVKNSNIQPIVAAFPVAAYYTDSVSKRRNAVIDVTSFINSDNSTLSFSGSMKRYRGLGNMFPDRSFIDTIKSFPLNVEIRTVKTYATAPPVGASPAQTQFFSSVPVTFELNTSMLLLPEKPMKARLFDPRVAYFAVGYTDFDSNPQGVERKSRITRWRLEPKPEDVKKYLAGELVEPQKPIVIYIDPATPKKWVPYLIAGVNDWQKAFEKAGFKNAIIGKEAPDDPSWSIEDARHSAIVYKASDIANASGPHVHDPRSGEILETHINWYHNVMNLLHNWYLIQASPSDPGARKVLFDDELMGQLIRFVSSHEVGHTLGLRHNFGSSASVPVEKLRDKQWVEANGHTPSIMDYARFNYVAQPEDSISQAGLFPRIGCYDEWSIEWGYRWLPQFETAEDEVAYNNKSVMDKLKSDPRFVFGTETDSDDPRNQNEDLGDNAMIASAYGIKNLKRIMPHVLEWTREPDKDYANARTLYNEIVTQWGRYAGHVAKNIAGIYRTPVTVEQTTNATEFVPASLQRDAMKFLNENVFATPEWLIDKTLIEKAEVNPISVIGTVQKRTIDRLISRNTISKMSNNEWLNGKNAYTSEEMFRDLKRGIWGELSNGKAIDIYRRNLQKNYVAALIALVNPPANQANVVSMGTTVSLSSSAQPSDAPGVARAQLIDLQQSIKSAAASSTGIRRSHLLDLDAQIKKALDPK
ncbi:MAG: zinc-dependent metalloprotease [Tannerella sp.]|nr:zinc-dependent metalloprotease [Tannerella sp.]